MKVKICGLRDPEAVDAAVDSGADWIGFVFFPPSPRWIAASDAARLAARLPRSIGAVGLFVEPVDDEIEAVLREVPLAALQIYVDASRIAGVRSRFGLPVWHAVGVASKLDLPGTASGADRLVLDAMPAHGADRPGGNAIAFDWPLLRDWKAPAPWLLAGGLTVDNVAQAARATGARAVDVSSGVETAPGRKDAALIRAFIAAARSAGM